MGSPPQVRGKLCQCGLRRPRSRITPAGAGKTPHFVLKSHGWEDHPRRCGENAFSMLKAAARTGSPPQVRGKLSFIPLTPLTLGITPAGAGKTYMFFRACATNRDHPRRCGENTLSGLNSSKAKGSPPQVRGKPAYVEGRFEMPGITPAGAGKTTVRT